MNPQPFKVQGEAILRLRQQRTVVRQIAKQITAMSNLRGSLECLPVPYQGAMHTVDETLEFLEKRRNRLQSELTTLVEAEFSRQLALLTTIKGIGITFATALIITTGGFSYFQNAKQVSRYIGICPTYEQSGTSVTSEDTSTETETHTPEDSFTSRLGLPADSMHNAKRLTRDSGKTESPVNSS